MSDRAPITGIVLMERGEPIVTEPDPEFTLNRLIENTDDAYTFPPYAWISPLFRIDGLDTQCEVSPDHEGNSGDDRGGLVVADGAFFYTGDSLTITGDAVSPAKLGLAPAEGG